MRAEVEQNCRLVRQEVNAESHPRCTLCEDIVQVFIGLSLARFSSLIGSHFDLVATEVHAAPPA